MSDAQERERVVDPIVALREAQKDGNELSFAVLVQALEDLRKANQAMQARLDETMKTHAALFEEKVQVANLQTWHCIEGIFGSLEKIEQRVFDLGR